MTRRFTHRAPAAFTLYIITATIHILHITTTPTIHIQNPELKLTHRAFALAAFILFFTSFEDTHHIEHGDTVTYAFFLLPIHTAFTTVSLMQFIISDFPTTAFTLQLGLIITAIAYLIIYYYHYPRFITESLHEIRVLLTPHS